MQKVNSIRSCKLKNLHVNCKNSDHLEVRLATEFISDTSATLLIYLFLGDTRKEGIA